MDTIWVLSDPNSRLESLEPRDFVVGRQRESTVSALHLFPFTYIHLDMLQCTRAPMLRSATRRHVLRLGDNAGAGVHWYRRRIATTTSLRAANSPSSGPSTLAPPHAAPARPALAADPDAADRAPASSSQASVPATTDLLEAYRSLVAQGRLTWDDEQVRIVMKVRTAPSYSVLSS
jgi:hypothetical protein